MKIIFFLIIAVLILGFYIRKAPVKPTRNAIMSSTTSDKKMLGGFTALRKYDGDVDNILARLTTIALSTPRTALLGHDPLQFITRSRFMGFPDVTTIQIEGGIVKIHAHLVFGKSDFGVNEARVLDWLDQADLLTNVD